MHAKNSDMPTVAKSLQQVMCAPPPQGRALLLLGAGVITMGFLNAAIGFSMLGERGDANRAKMRAALGGKEARDKP